MNLHMLFSGLALLMLERAAARRVADVTGSVLIDILATGDPAGLRAEELERWGIRALMLKPSTVRDLAQAAHAALQER